MPMAPLLCSLGSTRFENLCKTFVIFDIPLVSYEIIVLITESKQGIFIHLQIQLSSHLPSPGIYIPLCLHIWIWRSINLLVLIPYWKYYVSVEHLKPMLRLWCHLLSPWIFYGVSNGVLNEHKEIYWSHDSYVETQWECKYQVMVSDWKAEAWDLDSKLTVLTKVCTMWSRPSLIPTSNLFLALRLSSASFFRSCSVPILSSRSSIFSLSSVFSS